MAKKDKKAAVEEIDKIFPAEPTPEATEVRQAEPRYVLRVNIQHGTSDGQVFKWAKGELLPEKVLSRAEVKAFLANGLIEPVNK